MASILSDTLTSSMTAVATAVVGFNNNNNNNNNINTSSSSSDDSSTTTTTTTKLAEIILSTTNSTSRPRLGTAELNPDASDIVPLYMQHMTVILVILHLSVFITGLVGNSLVCLSVYRNKSLQTVTNYYIVNLAVADFLVILICLPPTVYWDLTLTWNFGLVLCKLVLYLQSISVSVSVLTLTCISIDRWYAICRPLEFCSTKSRAKRMIAMIWVVSMLIASPDVIFLTTRPLYEEDDYVYTDCTYSWPEENTKIYQLCIVSLLFILPFVFMIISYSHIVNVLWRNETMTESIQHSFQAEEGHHNRQERRTELQGPSSKQEPNQKPSQTGQNATKGDPSTVTTHIHHQYHNHSNQQTDPGACLPNSENVLLVDNVNIGVNDTGLANKASHRLGHRKVNAYEIGKINTNDWKCKKHHPRTCDASRDDDGCAFCMDENVGPISLDTIKESQCCSFESTTIGHPNANSSGRKRIRPHKQHNGFRHQQQQQCHGQHQRQRHHHHHHHHHHHRHHNQHNVLSMAKRSCCSVLSAPNCNKHDLCVKPRSLDCVEVDVAKTQNTSLSSSAPHEHNDRIYAGLIASNNNNNNMNEGDADDNSKKLKDQTAQLNGCIGRVCLDGKGGQCRGRFGDKTIEAKRVMSNNITDCSSSNVPSRLVGEISRELTEASGRVIISRRHSKQLDDNHDAQDLQCDIGRPSRSRSKLKNISDQSNSVSGKRSSETNPDNDNNNNNNRLLRDGDKTTLDFTVPLIEQSKCSTDDKNDYGTEIRSLLGSRERDREECSGQNSNENDPLVSSKSSDSTTRLKKSSPDEKLIDSSRGSSRPEKYTNQYGLLKNGAEDSNSSQTKTSSTLIIARNSISNDNETCSRLSSTKSLDMFPLASSTAQPDQSSSSTSSEEIDCRRASSGCTINDSSYAKATKIRNGEDWHLYTNTVDGCIIGQGNNDKSNGCNPITTQVFDGGYIKMQRPKDCSCARMTKCILASSDQCVVPNHGQWNGSKCGACFLTRSNKNNGSTIRKCNENKNNNNQFGDRDQSESKKGFKSRQTKRTIVLKSHVVNEIDCSCETSHYKTTIINNTSASLDDKLEMRSGHKEEQGDIKPTTARKVILGHKTRLKFNESQWHSASGQQDQSNAFDIFKEKNHTIKSDDHDEREGKQKCVLRSKSRCRAMMDAIRNSSFDTRSSSSSNNKIDCNDSSDNQTKRRGSKPGSSLANGNTTTTTNNNSLMVSSNQHQPAYRFASASNTNSINTQFYKLIESRKKAAKMLIVIVIMFGLCYLPIHFLNTLR